jgi:hypothetical protein
MAETISTYDGYRLTAGKQPSGGWLVEIVADVGGKPVLTKEFRELSDAIDSAHRIVDNVLKARGDLA